MLSFAGSLKVFVALDACDMCADPNTLQGLVGERLQEQVCDGALTKRWYRNLFRSHKKRLNWSKMNLHARRWLPLPKFSILTAYERFDAARTRGKSPVR